MQIDRPPSQEIQEVIAQLRPYHFRAITMPFSDNDTASQGHRIRELTTLQGGKSAAGVPFLPAMHDGAGSCCCCATVVSALAVCCKYMRGRDLGNG